MKYHLIYIFYIFFFLLSSLGAGQIFSRVINPKFKNLNLGYQGIIGIFFITIVSIVSSFFTKHGYLHNIILHSINLVFFLKLILGSKLETNELKKIFFLTIILIIGIYIYKNHDDFPYYHLTYSLNLSENSLIVGQGAFSHGFRTYSSIFYFHSTLFMPFINYFSFHMGPFLILIFFNYILIEKILNFPNIPKKSISYYFSLLSLSFVNVIFYRIGEHGTDRSAQILIFLIFVILIDTLFKNQKKNIQKLNIDLLLLLIIFAATLKSIYFIYLIIIFYIFLKKKKLLSQIFQFINPRFVIVLSIAFFMNFFINFLNTGCLLYPEEKTCVGKFDWSIPKHQVKKMKTHYEWWAKAGGGPSHKSKLSKDEYIKNFNWLKPWLKKHFHPKITDTLLGIVIISFILFLLIYHFHERKKSIKKNKNEFLSGLYFIIFIFLGLWFFKHPAMRYGGFVLITLPIFLFLSNFFSQFNISFNNKKKISLIFIILTLLSYNIRNFKRLDKEINFYNYPILQSPFYFVESIQSKIILDDLNFKVYSPINGKMCWASKTPCSYNNNINHKK
ncbi:hypothetical protein OAJ09_00835, partial [Candidatus Pelagibacter sp.]|nr:hypothetical protein [Candidatus Pelagibacter sp.]